MLYQILAFTTHGNNKFKISASTWNEEFELPDGLYFISDMQDYFEYILRNHLEKTVNPSMKIYKKKKEKRLTFKIKTGYYLERLTPETMKLFGSTKSKITKKENGKNEPYLEITEIVLIHCNLTVINKIQESCIYLFLINLSVNY